MQVACEYIISPLENSTAVLFSNRLQLSQIFCDQVQYGIQGMGDTRTLLYWSSVIRQNKHSCFPTALTEYEKVFTGGC